MYGLAPEVNRRAEGLFLAEGLRILTEAREAGLLPERLFFSQLQELGLLPRES